jgi:hypothetical protein
MNEETDPRLDRAIFVACAMQRWRDWSAHVAAYVLMNVVFIVAWLEGGKGYFWPAWPLIGWGIGISFQHFYASFRRPISSREVLPRLTRGEA